MEFAVELVKPYDVGRKYWHLSPIQGWMLVTLDAVFVSFHTSELRDKNTSNQRPCRTRR
ncbi:hypothetical protein BD779DRAFT_1538390 [Infundibulicybe gibba]|nr:hypothetical protein BD779DRAFT_1538390 [Infundibulicybe gibba]